MDQELPIRHVKKIMGSNTVISRFGAVTKRCNYCIIFIPGNPGIIEFYDVFLLKLHQLTGCRVPVIGIAQAGHSPAWEYAEVDTVGEFFTVAEQILHKIEFIQNELPPKTKLLLIGHSVVLKMLENHAISQRLIHAINLFPAIEDLKDTPNGRFWMPVSKYCRLPFALLAFVFSFAPNWFKNALVAWRAKGRPVHEKILKPCHSCVSFSLMNHALYMAATEMDDMKELDESIIAIIHKHESKLTFYYGSADKWAPLSFYERMRNRFSKVDIRLCDCGYPHDFVLDSSEQVAKLCFDILQDRDCLDLILSKRKTIFNVSSSDDEDE